MEKSVDRSKFVNKKDYSEYSRDSPRQKSTGETIVSAALVGVGAYLIYEALKKK